MGVAKPQLQAYIKERIPATKQTFLDNEVASWCDLMSSSLEDAGSRMIEWDQAKRQVFIEARNRSAARASSLSRYITNVLVFDAAAEFLAEASGTIQTVGEILSVGAPQARVGAKGAQAVKYATNLTRAFITSFEAFALIDRVQLQAPFEEL